MVEVGLYLSYALLGVAALATIVFPIIHMVKNPDTAKRTGISIIGLLIIFGISFVFAKDDIITKFDYSAADYKLVGAALIGMYILVFGTVLSILYSEISGIFK